MKDYYYFLGISREASADEVRKVYRKLSLKYHPDKNGNDPFFDERFREVQEAYDMLIDPDKRKTYDRTLESQNSTVQYTLPPVIRSFNINKIRVLKGEEIIITWRTSNADVVKIQPFGLVNAYGEKRIKITEFKDKKFHVLLQATNSLLNKTVVKGVTLTQIFEGDKERLDEQVDELFQPKSDRSFTKDVKAYLYIAAAILLLIVWYIATQFN